MKVGRRFSLWALLATACHGTGRGATVADASGTVRVDGGLSRDAALADAPVAADAARDLGSPEFGPADAMATADAPDAGVDAGSSGDAADGPAPSTFLVGVIAGAKLVRIEPTSGATTPIAPLSVANVFMLSFDPTSGKLYGIRETFSTPLLDLVTVDPCTAAVSTIGPLRVETGTLRFVEGFAVNPANGALYITGSLTHVLPDSSSEALLTVNPTTAVATFVANTNSPSGDVDNLLFVGDTLYATDVEGPTSNQTFLYKMDPATAAVTTVGTPSSPTQVFQLARDPQTGTIYASDLKPTVHFGTATLATNTYAPIADVPGLGSVAFVSASCR